MATSLLEKTTAFVKTTLKGAEGGHDWFHTKRVLENARLIAKGEPVNLLIVELAALLHDIADAKFHDGDETVGPKLAFAFLDGEGLEPATTEHICNIIKYMSFKNSFEDGNTFQSNEMQVVQDADRLDAIGAIGIARAFNYGGYKNREMYNPDIPPNLKMTKTAYKKSQSPTINHFYEKLLLLKDRMHTKTGKKIAKKRHQFLVGYLEQFFAEWEGKR